LEDKIVKLEKHHIIVILSLFTVGCKCFQCNEPSYQGPPEFKPLPPEKLHDLLHISENYAYKSVTKKDYEGKDECHGI
jgi:hypothetical protein